MYGQWEDDSLSAISVSTEEEQNNTGSIQKVQQNRKSRTGILYSHGAAVPDTDISTAGSADTRIGD